MTTTMTVDDLTAMRGQDVYGNDGSKIGSLEQVYIDNDNGEPEWVSVKTGLFGTNESLVPLSGASSTGDGLQVAHSKDTVKDAPNVESDQELSEEEERRLYEHYGLDRRTTTDADDERTDFRTRETGDDRTRERDGDRTGDAAMTLRGEELHVDKTRRETGRARLSRHVVTEQQQVTVPVEREVARIAREPITDGGRDVGGELSEDVEEITLSQEEVQVSKKTVPKERVNLAKDVVTEDRTVTEDVSHEEVDIDGDIEEPRRR